MEQQTVLTPEQRKQIQESMQPWQRVSEFGLAIEQAVLQSPEVQAWKKDAQRYKTWRDSYFLAENNPINWGLVCAQTADQVDAALDAMEKQP